MTTEQTTSNQIHDIFVDAARKNIHRDGLEDLLAWLEETDFYEAPASTKFHGVFVGGLVTHSYNVYCHLRMLNDVYNGGLSEESMAIAALFHDLCKANSYKLSSRNVKDEKTGVWNKVPYYMFDELYRFGGHGSKSVYLVQSHMKLTPDEASAINCHMGAWEKTDYGNPAAVYDVNPLAWFLHVADEAASHLNKT